VINGRKLHDGTDPIVTLSGVEIEGPHDLDAAGDQVVVDLPPALPDGTHRLTLLTSDGFDFMDMAISTPIAAGPGLTFGGPGGTLGVDFGNLRTAGGIVIESTGNSVRIIAGTSKITINPSGSIAIQSPSKLDLTAANIDIEASSTLTLKGATVKVEGTSQTQIKAPSTRVDGTGLLDLNGGLITLN
jgi:hypothetical protein